MSNDNSTQESIVHLIVENNAYAYLVQEVWLIGTGIKVTNLHTMFYHFLIDKKKVQQ